MMAGNDTAVFGIYWDRRQAEEALEALRAAGFRHNCVSVLFPGKAPEETAAGGEPGAMAGGALGWLAGIGALAIPGAGPFVAAGPMMGMLAGVGVGGAVGGLTPVLVGLGLPECEARRYGGRVRAGGVLLTVHCDNSDWVKGCKDILKDTGAGDVSSTGEARTDHAGSERTTPGARASAPQADERDISDVDLVPPRVRAGGGGFDI